MQPTAGSERSDEELVASYCRSGHRELLDVLLARHVGPVRGIVYGMVLDQSDADDVTQEVFLAAIRGLAQFNGRSKFSTWLYRVAVNTTYRFLERRSRRPAGGEALLPDPPASPGDEPDQKAMQSELEREIAAGMEALSPPLRAAMVLMTLEGLSADEAAQIEECSPATMYWRVHEARRILCARLAKYLKP
jgi:RNA polymerase sigma-70 factor (ECF subfamily)